VLTEDKLDEISVGLEIPHKDPLRVCTEKTELKVSSYKY
jgi:hypothetical protein